MERTSTGGGAFGRFEVTLDVSGLLTVVREPVLLRAFEYWHNVDKNLGDRVETEVRARARA